jgi:hypothetical protein
MANRIVREVGGGSFCMILLSSRQLTGCKPSEIKSADVFKKMIIDS